MPQQCSYRFVTGPKKGQQCPSKCWAGEMCSEHRRRGSKKQGLKEKEKVVDFDEAQDLEQAKQESRGGIWDQLFGSNEEPSTAEQPFQEAAAADHATQGPLWEGEPDEFVATLLNTASEHQAGLPNIPQSKAKSSSAAEDKKKKASSLSNSFLIQSAYFYGIGYIEQLSVKQGIDLSGMSQSLQKQDEVKECLDQIAQEFIGDVDLLQEANPIVKLGILTAFTGIMVLQSNTAKALTQSGQSSSSSSPLAGPLGSSSTLPGQPQPSYHTLVHQYNDI